MKDNNNICINYEVEIPRSHLCKAGGRGAFSMINDQELILAYNQENEDNFHEKGKLIRIKQGKIDELFETEKRIWAPVLDSNNIFLVTQCSAHGEDYEQGIIFRISSSKILDWHYQLEGETNSLPVIYQDSLFITDFIRSARRGNLYRFNKDGGLILKKSIRAFNTFEPWILNHKEQIIISFNKPKILEVLDFNGNTQIKKEVSNLGNPLFSQNAEGELFAAINGAVIAMDRELNILWEYKPSQGFAYMAPVFDSAGNLFSVLNGRRLVSLDFKGRERWVTTVSGHGYQPCILSNDNVMVVTSEPSGKRPKEEQFTTYIEIYSNTGRKTGYYEIPGYIFHFINNIDRIYLATNCTRTNVERESEIRSIKIFSLTLS